MAEAALRKLDRGLPRLDMRAPALAARQRERLIEKTAPPMRAEIRQAREAALDDIRAEAARIIASAQEEAAAIVGAALAEARQQLALAVKEARALVDVAGMVEEHQPQLRMVADIIREVAARTGVPARRIVGRDVAKHIVAARREAMAEAYLARPDLSLPTLGRLFGDRDHTTVRHALIRAGVYDDGRAAK
ncbi:MAG: hypothetical protein J0I98_06615 [Mesorhizobium sp.]|nr:helix-turn-helix domain-containing protein [Mesorhizobium sp.]MBN9242447.1 hypothetical protein [Mesorhizobium sp.]